MQAFPKTSGLHELLMLVRRSFFSPCPCRSKTNNLQALQKSYTNFLSIALMHSSREKCFIPFAGKSETMLISTMMHYFRNCLPFWKVNDFQLIYNLVKEI